MTNFDKLLSLQKDNPGFSSISVLNTMWFLETKKKLFFIFNLTQLTISVLFLNAIFFFHFFSVSFYGASHIAMPLQEAKISTNIRLRFRTHQESSLIFLAAGRTDYCLISLDDGRIKLNYKIDDHLTEVNIDSWQFVLYASNVCGSTIHTSPPGGDFFFAYFTGVTVCTICVTN